MHRLRNMAMVQQWLSSNKNKFINSRLFHRFDFVEEESPGNIEHQTLEMRDVREGIVTKKKITVSIR